MSFYCNWYLPLALSSLWPLTWWHFLQTITFQNKMKVIDGVFCSAVGCFNSGLWIPELLPFFRSTLRTKRMFSLSWGMRGYLMRLTLHFQQKRMIFFFQLFSKSLEIKDEGKSRLGKLTFILCLFLCQIRASQHSLHLPLFPAPRLPLLSASQAHWLPFSSLDMLYSDVLCLENFPPSSPNSSSSAFRFLLTHHFLQEGFPDFSDQVSPSITDSPATCGSVLKYWSQL